MKLLAVLCIASLFCAAYADLYMHNPRGSNNRLNGDGTNRENNNRLCDTQNNAKGGYVYGPPMYFYVGSRLEIEWTNQHGCGNPNTHCQIIIQYMCGSEVRDGVDSGTPPDDAAQYNVRVANPDPVLFKTGDDGLVFKYGMHESYQYYQDCKNRQRNLGLFIADQNVGGSARNTRQNPGGNRSGFECPEERDYYPYWHPSPWIDIAVLTDDDSRCDYYHSRSQNNDDKNYCTEARYNNAKDCKAGGGQWKSVGSNGGSGPVCKQTAFSRDNHLGNGDTGETNRFYWTIPDNTNSHCVLRMRYNISSGDYDGWDIDAKKNGEKSPVKDDPYVNFGGKNLSLAIDTTQFGRTFQDRSHTFAIRSRGSIRDEERIFNLNVRGKRGNIVQVYPAVEYDFVPTNLKVRSGDRIHFQWTGANNNPAGNDGEGKAKTDRSNWVEMDGRSDNIFSSKDDNGLLDDDDKMLFAHLNQTNCQTLDELIAEHGNNQNAIEQDDQNCMKLNAASPYFNGGLIKIDKEGNYNYMSTRNNNFTNRSQKGNLEVVPFLPLWAIILISFASAVCLAAIVVSGLGFYGRTHPDGRIGGVWKKINSL